MFTDDSLTAQGKLDRDRIILLRNNLALWAMGKASITLMEMSKQILELDQLLQQFDL